MSGINKVILIGNLGKDPEIRRLESGVAVAKFSLATSESYKNREGNRIDQTEWHNIVLWRGLAEVAEKYLTKGKQVYIEGRIKTRSWEDKDGNKRYTTEIIGDNMTMLGGRRDQTDDPVPVSQAEKPLPVSPEIETPEDDLPF
ncbi:MAG: single-stranded DNA-binding protein [Bacteroidales bacterium]|nr:single-stranded DNA-binding protein [Bacteroidales bacterium]